MYAALLSAAASRIFVFWGVILLLNVASKHSASNSKCRKAAMCFRYMLSNPGSGVSHSAVGPEVNVGKLAICTKIRYL